MANDFPRIRREKQTVRAMVRIYCRDHHETSDALCGECGELLDYALSRLDHCPFGTDKTTCANCTVHCYKPAMRDRTKEIMRYAGPRMLLRHPILAVFHLLDRRREPKLA